MILLFYNLRLSVSSTSYCDICSIVFPENVYIFSRVIKYLLHLFRLIAKFTKKQNKTKTKTKNAKTLRLARVHGLNMREFVIRGSI